MKRSLSFIATSLFLALGMFFAIAGQAFADDATPPPGFVQYTVKPGDSLGRIALRTGTTIEKLKAVNNLKVDVLQIGQVLWIPGFVASSAPVVPGRPANLPAGSVQITGAGATFPAPLYASWIFTYQQVDPVAAINYQPIGSGGGKKAIVDRTVDFAGSDSLVTAAEYAAGGDLQMYPMVAGAVVTVFNLKDAKTNLPIKDMTLSRPVLANIFLGVITNWNDPAIAKLNSKISLPNKPIVTVHRSDGSGTTEIFTKSLSSFSSVWKAQVGGSSAVQWPNGLGGRGNAGVAATVSSTPNSIGYVELSYAVPNKLSYAAMINKAGAVVRAGGQSINAAMSDFSGGFSAQLTEDIVDAPGTASWPIAGYTYIVLHTKSMTDCVKAQTLLAYIKWALTDPVAGGTATALGYAQLPGEVRSQALARLTQVTCNGAAVLRP